MRQHRIWQRVASTCVATATAWTLAAPQQAEACGGSFCDGGNPQQAVNQDSENVLFVLGDGEVETHIQISIDPNTQASQFAWLIPISAVPEFEVGSQPLFNALLQGSVPTYGLQTTFEACGEGGLSGGISTGAPNDSAGATGGTSDGGEDTGPTILKTTTVGAFEIVVLTDKTVAPIKQWLVDNGFQWIDSADAVIQQYLDEGNLVMAFKLRTGADKGDVHPIVLRYPSTETCFPLRLTRVAAVEDMDIRVFLLAKERAAPTNYRHVLVNPLKIDWLNLAANYKEVIKNAVDELKADGLAFVTEYAGVSTVTDPFEFSVLNAAWNEGVFEGLAPEQVVNELNNQGLTACWDEFDCSYIHPLARGLLNEFLPVPDGVEEDAFYANLPAYAAQIDAMAWGDGTGFAKAMADRIILPGVHAMELLDTWPYLTRMYTVISPNEMLADPIFHLNPDLPDVANLQIAQQFRLCDGNSVVTLPDGREVFVPNSGPWPDIMAPWWAETIEEVALKGKPMHLVNNTAAIDKRVTEWNLAHNWPRPPAGDSGAGSAGSASAGESASDTAGQDEDAGCNCDSQGGSQGALWLGVAGLGLLAARRRRAR